MRAAALAALLVAACLLGPTWQADAQTAPTIPTPSEGRGPPARNDAPEPPLAWSNLSPGQQRMLAPLQDQWEQMRPAHQHRLAEHALHWASLPAARQARIREHLARWAAMTPQQRQQLRENARAFHDLTPEQRAKIRAAYQRFRALPPDARKSLRERWRAMPPAERMHWATEHPDQPIPAHPPAHHGH